MTHVVPVVLCGGSGSRLWPLSRESYPKQLLPLVSGTTTMLEDTVQRCATLAPAAAPIVVTNESHRFLLAEQLARSGQGDALIVLEPEGRNTAPAVAVAALLAMEEHADAVLFVAPADHVVRDVDALSRAVEQAAAAADARRQARGSAVSPAWRRRSRSSSIGSGSRPRAGNPARRKKRWSSL